MGRAFEPYLQMALSQARNPTLDVEATTRNIKLFIGKALNFVKPSVKTHQLAIIATAQCELALAHRNMPYASSQADAAAKEALSEFEQSLEQLRIELQNCEPADIARAIGLK